MRDYAKLAPTFWTGETGKALRRRGSEAMISALYLVSSPHSNMLGVYYQPIGYMGHETGLGFDGATKGLQACIEVGFCSYDEDTEMVYVHEMAAWQIAEELKATDLRCKGIQKDYESLPNCPFLEAFFDRYASSYHLKKKRSNPVAKPGSTADSEKGLTKGVTKPLRSQEQEQEQEQEYSEAKASGAAAPPPFADLPKQAGKSDATSAEPDAKPMTAKDRVWLLGPPLLGEKGRGLLGKLAKAHGDEVLADVLAEATLDPPLEPKAWVTAACEARAKAHPQRPNGTHYEAVDMLSDPTPDWAIRAGFTNRFEAENAGCLKGNAAKFQNGQRIAQ